MASGYNDPEGSGRGISSHELRLRDLPSKSLLGEGLGGIGYETEWEGKRRARKDFVGVPSGIFREEAANLVGLEDHKNIVKTYGWTVDKRSCSLVLEFMDDDLLGLLQKRKESKRSLADIDSGSQYDPSHSRPFELLEALNVMMEIAEGMKQLHDRGTAHGDLKTRNILVNHMNDLGGTSSLSVKVADFGLVRTKRKSMFFVSRQALKLDMVQWKAPEYLSILIPLGKLEDKDETSSESDSNSEENTSTRSGVDTHLLRSHDVFAADVYSFAVTCSQILTGEDPYPNSNWKELLDKILHFGLRPKLFDSCPPALKELLQSCWDKEPSRRPTFSDIQQSLQVIAFLPGSSRPSPEQRMPTSSLARTGGKAGSGDSEEGDLEEGVSEKRSRALRIGVKRFSAAPAGRPARVPPRRGSGAHEIKESNRPSQEGGTLGSNKPSPLARPQQRDQSERGGRGGSRDSSSRGGRKPRNINKEYVDDRHIPTFGVWNTGESGEANFTDVFAAARKGRNAESAGDLAEKGSEDLYSTAYRPPKKKSPSTSWWSCTCGCVRCC